MKFVSRQGNLRVVLRPGTPREPVTGRDAVPGLYVKFENGIAMVNDDKMCEMLKNHRLYNTDFFALDENEVDPFKNRKSLEPDHNVAEIEYGRVKANLNPRPPVVLSKEQKAYMEEIVKKAVAEAALPLAKEMAEKAVKEIVAMSEKAKEEKTIKTTKKVKTETTSKATN